MIEILHVLLYLALILFFAGLPIFVLSINHTVYIYVLLCVGTLGIFYLLSPSCRWAAITARSIRYLPSFFGSALKEDGGFPSYFAEHRFS